MKHRIFFQIINARHLLLAALLSLGLSLFGYLVFFQSPLLSRREYAFTLLLWFALTPLLYLLLTRFLLPRLNPYSPRTRYNWLLLSIGVGILFALVTHPPQLIFLLPKHTLQVLVPAGSADRSITLEYATNSLLGDISFSQFSTTGNWVREGANLRLTGHDPASLSWTGRTGQSATLVFTDSPSLSGVLLGWDGVLSPIDTDKASIGQIPLEFSFESTSKSDLIGKIILGLSAGFFFLVFTMFLVNYDPQRAFSYRVNRGYWLLYTLPMIFVWLLFLLVFFPGLITQDTYVQWEQIVTGQFSDAHPIFFALLIKAVSAIYNSPAAVVLAQILMLTLSLSWGFAELERMGCPRKALWILSVLCAIMPVNILAALVLRKDIPFSASVLALSVIFLKLINTRGEWLRGKWNWLGLGVILGIISLSRINGLPISIGALVVIPLLYRPAWRRVWAAAGIFALMLLLMYGPIYKTLRVKHVSEFGSVLFLHHIAAHLAAGTPLSSDQVDYLAKLAPLKDWNYDCCTNIPTTQAIFPGANDQNYDLPLIKQDVQKPTRIALALFLKDPLVDIRHMVCAGQIVWNPDSSCPDRIIVRMQPLSDFQNPIHTFHLRSNLMGFSSNSIIPSLIQYANPYLQVYSDNFFHWLNFTPSVILYLSIYCTVIVSIRRKNWRLMLFLVPVMLQSLTLLLVNISQAYRYQYGVVLVALISIGFLFLPKENDYFKPGSQALNRGKKP